MKRIIAAATFVALGAGAAEASAQPFNMLGSDTLNKITDDIIAVCDGATGIDYIGTGSGNGETALIKGNQQIAPMSRFLANSTAVCGVAPDSTAFEALDFAQDKLAVFIHPNHQTACDPGSTAPGCNAVAGGLDRFSCPALDGSVPGSGDWKNALRLLFHGLGCEDGANPSNVPQQRNCNDPRRIDLINNWSTYFENGCAGTGSPALAGGACTQLKHVFRRDEGSGTTDFFREAIQSNASANTGGNGFPFCNEFWVPPTGGQTCSTVAPLAPCPFGLVCSNPAGAGTCQAPATPAGCGDGARDVNEEECDDGNTNNFDGCSQYCLIEPAPNGCTADMVSATPTTPVGAPGVPNPPYLELYQDNDPVRSACPPCNQPLAGGNPNNDQCAENVCGRRGNLGVVLPISPPQDLIGVPEAEFQQTRYSTQTCTRGVFINGAPPRIVGGLAANQRFGVCPDGTTPRGTSWDAVNRWAVPVAGGGVPRCPIPAFQVSAGPPSVNDARCMNPANNDPVATPASFPQPACVLTSAQADGRAFNLHLRSATGGYPSTPYFGANRDVVGAFYRIHTNRVLAGPTTAALNLTCTDGVCCTETDATRQLGCIVAASPCSTSFAGVDGAIPVLDAVWSGPVSAHTASLNQVCNLGAPPAPYPMVRSLFLSTLIGFENVGSGASPIPPALQLGLAQCYSGENLDVGFTLTDRILASEFIPYQTGPRCTDFANAGCSDPEVDACANNPVDIACQNNGDCASGNCQVFPEPGGRTRGTCQP